MVVLGPSVPQRRYRSVVFSLTPLRHRNYNPAALVRGLANPLTLCRFLPGSGRRVWAPLPQP